MCGDVENNRHEATWRWQGCVNRVAMGPPPASYQAGMSAVSWPQKRCAWFKMGSFNSKELLGQHLPSPTSRARREEVENCRVYGGM